MRILVIEDDARVGRIVGEALARAQLDADVFPTMAQGSYALSLQHYHGVILDRQLPDGDGLSLIRRWRCAGNPVPCLVLTGRDTVHDRVDGLEAGADDYLTKPFAVDELLARVRALLRRPPQLAQRLHVVGELVIDVEVMTATLAGRRLVLTAREFHVLRLLAEAQGQLVTRQRLFDQVYGHCSDVGKGGLDVTLHRLRRKLIEADAKVCVTNQPNVGYRLSLHADA
ncbi:response regulator transcription factor [Tahibacter sp.]|uniref:response regulator transcription factor n=1 Tax=Tahibacter sp. TaxID=2056211 RepID=UPI0028C3C65B|nr:response regulator transcription factor [Tahibacter sp.]